MEVFGYCRKCHNSFDAHWHQYPELKTHEAIMHPYCPKCKGYDVQITNDESGDYESDESDLYFYDEED